MNNLRFNPVLGVYYDPTTGQSYSQNQAGSLNLNQLTARDVGVSNDLLSQLSNYNRIYNQANGGQTKLVGQLDQVINGTAPSVAQTQLTQNTDQIAKQQQSQASGATGVNAAIARYAAMQNTAAAQQKANQDAALLRANEVAQARQEKAGVLGAQAGEATNLYGANLSGAGNFSGEAGSTQGNQASIDQQRDTANKQLIGNLVGAGGTAGVAFAKSDKNEKTNIKSLDGPIGDF